MEIFFRMTWADKRLAYDMLTNQTKPIVIGGDTLEHIWIPDVYFGNAKSSEMHDVLASNRAAYIHPNGSVRFSVR